MQPKIVCGVFMEKPDDPITVGRITLPYSHLLNGWLMPDGTVIKNPIKAQNEAERLNGNIVFH
ncbi:phage protein [Pantoea ananatis LMG 5342]|nr:phage protein [Pantoea ananatis LMG 5342]